jgi:hypothetical protein
MSESATSENPDTTQSPPVPPLDVDGVGAVIVGTVLFAVAFVILLLFRPQLAEADASWWLIVTAAGFGLGLLALAYTTRRRRVYRAVTDEEATPTEAEEA